MEEKLVGVMNKEDMVTEIETLINKLDTMILGLLDMYRSGEISKGDFNTVVLDILTFKYFIRDLQATLDGQEYYHLKRSE